MDITHAIILLSHFCLRGKVSEWASERVGVFFNNFIMSNLIWVSSYISLAFKSDFPAINFYIFFTCFKYLLPYILFYISSSHLKWTFEFSHIHFLHNIRVLTLKKCIYLSYDILIAKENIWFDLIWFCIVFEDFGEVFIDCLGDTIFTTLT